MSVKPRSCAGASTTRSTGKFSSSSETRTCALVGRPAGDPKARCSTAATPHASTTAPNTSFTPIGPTTERGEREQREQELSESPHRSREERLGGEDDGGDHREVDRGIRPWARAVEHADERVAERMPRHEQAHEPRAEPCEHTTEPEHETETPPARDERGDDHEADAPQRADREQAAVHAAEPMRPVREQAIDAQLGRDLVTDVQCARDEERDRERQLDPVGGETPVRMLVGVAEAEGGRPPGTRGHDRNGTQL